jgi:hypothetical protein
MSSTLLAILINILRFSVKHGCADIKTSVSQCKFKLDSTRSPKIMQGLPQFLPEILALNVKLSLDVH